MARRSLLLLLLLALSLSEGRVVSRCELRDELLQRVELPRNLQRNKERAMARVICAVERLSSLNTALVREYEKEIIDLDDSTTAAPPPTTTTTALNTTTTTTALNSTITTTTATAATTTTTTTSSSTAPTTAPPRPPTAPATTEKLITETTANPPPNTEINPTTTNAPTTSPSSPTTSENANATSSTAPVSLARRRRAARQKRASISTVSVKFFGIFQFSDHKYCNSGYSVSEDRCMSNCFDFADEDISNDLECFVQSRLFLEVYRGATRSCRSRRILDSFFEACDAGETPQSADNVVSRIFLSGGSYK